MKKLSLYLIALFGTFGFTACNYLDIVPEEREKEADAYTSSIAADNMLYSCYGYMPNPYADGSSLDFFTGDEVLTPFNNIDPFAQGHWTANTGATQNEYKSLYAGIRQCWLFLDHMDDFAGIEERKANYIAQCHFLIAYYHMRLLMGWGPIILVDKVEDVTGDLDTQYRQRNTLKECIDFIVKQYDEAINSNALKDEYSGNETGLATSVIAKSMKAYALMYYASPLLNGNADLSAKMRNPDGSELIPAAEEPERWEEARKAYLEAIRAAHTVGHTLFTKGKQYTTNKYPDNQTVRNLRDNMPVPIANNSEVIWSYYTDPSQFQRRCMPFIDKMCWNGVAPTLNMVRRFYTINGLPCDRDTEFNIKAQEFKVVKVDDRNKTIALRDGSNTSMDIALKDEETSYMNLNREPRYYAWISFQGGFYEMDTKEGYAANSSVTGLKVLEKNALKDGIRLTTEFVRNGNCGMQQRTANYSRTGFLNKKGVHTDSQSDKTNPSMKKYPSPILRLADLYLAYAECATECGKLGNESDDVSSLPEGARAYLNAVRVRAGIPKVDDSWRKIGVTIDQDQMREIVRQERSIELYLERQNFWDMRRWLKAEECFNGPYKGMNVEGETVQEFSREADVVLNERTFEEANYFFPFPSYDINNNPNCAQNPGY